MGISFQLKDGRSVDVRPLTKADASAAQRFFVKIGEQTIFTNQYPGQPIKDLEQLTARYENKTSFHLGAFDGSELVGHIFGGILKPDHPWVGRTCRFGLMILDGYKRQGIAGFLMEQMEMWAKDKKMHRIEASVRCQNLAAIALYLKKGFVIEGQAKETAFINGVWHDEYLIAKLLD